ncbi:MAG TPA: DUF2845 domain-containing protein [Gammaproteobacteria bacterium]|nr:DUF2845 domain-containing protein [Gammaproteobacteria bacterium]
MHIQWIIWPSAFLLLLAMSSAFGWRCEHGLVNIGDSASQVRKKCGLPDYVYSDTGTFKRGKFVAIDARWYYNDGPRLLLRELRFHKGKLAAVDTPGYGFRPDQKRCTPQDINTGMSAYELASRCGKPNSERDRDTHIRGGKASGGKLMMHSEEWTYDFGPQYLLQKVTIVSGHVQDRKAVSRTKHPAKRPP